MKHTNKLLLLLVVTVSVLFFNACDDDSDMPAPTSGTVNFVFKNEVDGQLIQQNSMIYSNTAGNSYSVTLLKYYISNITFVNSDGSEFVAPNYELVDDDSAGSKIFSMNVPFGNYTNLKFLMGVDSAKNHSGAQAGELSPDYGMFWDWNTGYVNFKHEGEFLDSAGVVQPIMYHYGDLKALIPHEMNIAFPVSTSPIIITVTFNLNKIYRSPNVIDFNGNNLNSGTPPWLLIMKENLPGAFTVTSIE